MIAVDDEIPLPLIDPLVVDMFPFVVDMFPYEVIVSFVVEMYRIVVIALLVVVLPFANTANY